MLLSLSFIPIGQANREGIASMLEHSVFLPYRLALGWGPRSILDEHELSRLKKKETEVARTDEEGRETEAENRRLRLLLGFERRGGYELLPATVLGRGRERYGELVSARPADAGSVVPGMPVVNEDGLIGRVSAVHGGIARIEGLKNQNVAVSVINQRSREEGIVKWQPERRSSLVVQGVSSQADWQIGDRIVTSGLGAVFPRGLLVGWVIGGETEGSGLLRQIQLRPAANLARAEEVFILLQAPYRDPGVEDAASSLYPLDPGRDLSRRSGPPSEAFASGPTPTP